MIENFSIAVRLLSIQNDKIANSMLEEYGMTNGQFKVLNLLYARPAFSLRQVDIEEFFQISNPTVTVILNSLEKKGLVERRINPSDSRSKLIGVTEKAEEMRGQMHAVEKSLSGRLDEILSPEEKAQLMALLNRVIEGILSPGELYRYREPEEMKTGKGQQ